MRLPNVLFERRFSAIPTKPRNERGDARLTVLCDIFECGLKKSSSLSENVHDYLSRPRLTPRYRAPNLEAHRTFWSNDSSTVSSYSADCDGVGELPFARIPRGITEIRRSGPNLR